MPVNSKNNLKFYRRIYYTEQKTENPSFYSFARKHGTKLVNNQTVAIYNAFWCKQAQACYLYFKRAFSKSAKIPTVWRVLTQSPSARQSYLYNTTPPACRKGKRAGRYTVIKKFIVCSWSLQGMYRNRRGGRKSSCRQSLLYDYIRYS